MKIAKRFLITLIICRKGRKFVHLKLASGAAGIAFTITFAVTGKGILRVLGNDGANEYLTDEQGVFLVP